MVAVVIAGATIASSALEAQQVPNPEKAVQIWIDRASEARELVSDGEHRRARKQLDRLLAEMCDDDASSRAPASLLASAVVLRALTEAALNNDYDAAWDLAIARALDPDLGGEDPSEYRELADKLKAAELRWGAPAHYFDGRRDEVSDGRFEPPQKRQGSFPKRNRRKPMSATTTVAVGTFVDRTGRIRSPHLPFGPSQPVLAFAAMDHLRRWKVSPARLDGEPIAAYYEFRFHFR